MRDPANPERMLQSKGETARREWRIAPLTLEETTFVDQRLPLARLDQPGTYLIAWDGEEPVAHAFVWESGEHLLVGDVWVLPERRREGLASALMDAIERTARERGLSKIELTCDAENELQPQMLGFHQSMTRCSFTLAKSGPGSTASLAASIPIRGRVTTTSRAERSV